MKFGKEFAAQKVPEWEEAYMNYNYLKSLIKDIQLSIQKDKPPPPTPAMTSSTATPRHINRRLSLYRAFSGLTRSRHNQSELSTSTSPPEGSDQSDHSFLMASEEGEDIKIEYLRKVDDELNKVDKFYKAKVDEVMKEANVLNKQMDALIAFRVKVENPQRMFDWSGEITRLASDVASSTAHLAASTPREVKASRRADVALNVIEEGDLSSSHSGEDEKEKDEVVDVKKVVKVEKPRKFRVSRPAPLDVLSHVTMNKTIETPVSTIKGFLNVSQQTELKFSRENLIKVEEQLKSAFVVFYQKLRLLKSFGFLNTMAFSKIMKKYDKVTSRNTLKPYMKMVDNSYLGSSDEVSKLIKRVESVFVKHFSNSNHRKGMALLRPKPKIERHRITFFMGCFFGSTVALTLALVFLIRARDIMNKPGRITYMETIFPLYSLFGFVFLHMLMYAANIYFWRRYRVNYSFIFGFKQGTEMGYREVLLVSFGLAMLALGAVLSNLEMEMDPKTKDYKQLTELLPLFLLLLVIVILVSPFNIVYRSSRYFFLVCMFHGICAPLYKVTLSHFFLADQLTSQVQALRNLQFYVCYYGWGDYKLRKTSCRENDVFETFYIIVACIPYWSRLLQCLRRLFEEKDVREGYNGLKYFFTIVAITMRTISVNHSWNVNWKILAVIFSVIAALYGTYWDLVVDWGLLQRNSKNPWLRDKLVIPHNSVYFGAMVLNVLMRFAWLQTVLGFDVTFLHTQTMLTVVACLEIIRRGIWSFFRLENEHLNNVGKYRAFKSVPLPFNYDEDHKDH